MLTNKVNQNLKKIISFFPSRYLYLCRYARKKKFETIHIKFNILSCHSSPAASTAAALLLLPCVIVSILFCLFVLSCMYSYTYTLVN